MLRKQLNRRVVYIGLLIILAIVLGIYFVLQQKGRADSSGTGTIKGIARTINEIPISGNIIINSDKFNKKIPLKDGNFIINDMIKSANVTMRVLGLDGYEYGNSNEGLYVTLNPGKPIILNNLIRKSKYLSDEQINDTTPPTITKKFDNTFTLDKDVTLNFEIKDTISDNIKDVGFWYRFNANDDWSLGVLDINGTTYTTTFKLSDIQNKTAIYYYIQASDRTGNTAIYPMNNTGQSGSQNPEKIALSQAASIVTTPCPTRINTPDYVHITLPRNNSKISINSKLDYGFDYIWAKPDIERVEVYIRTKEGDQLIREFGKNANFGTTYSIQPSSKNWFLKTPGTYQIYYKLKMKNVAEKITDCHTFTVQ